MSPAEPGEPVATALAERLKSDRPPSVRGSDPAAKELWSLVRRFYEDAGHRPAWIEDGAAGPAVATLRRAVAEAIADGLNPAHYELGNVDVLPKKSWNPLKRDEADAAVVADLDIRFTATAIKLVSHLVRGRVEPGTVGKHWFGHQREDDVVAVLRAGFDAGQVDKAFDLLRPRHPQYEGLKRALAEHRRIAAAGGWPTVPVAAAVKPGQSDPAVATLRSRLQASGELPGSAADATVFDASVKEALGRFQRRHGLAPTGRLDKETRAALNVPVEARVRQIEINMERWRWLPNTPGDEYILVNIPTFHLAAVENGRPALEMAVVTGTRGETPTPIFSDDMTTVVFSPYWNVPKNILREETIPAAMNNPGFIARQNMEVLVGDRVVDPWSVDWRDPRLRVRQRPGAGNALGHVKFIFPNNFAVYLHDTPADALFAQTDRDYSHGCVRVEKPFELAQWVLRDHGEWTAERIQSAMYSGQEKHVALGRKIPVYIVYATVWTDDDGTVKFRDDVYGHDARQDRVVPASPAPTVLAAAGGAARGVS